MGDVTANRSYPFPLSTDTVNPPGDFEALAEAIDDDVTLVLQQLGVVAAPVTTSSNGTITSGTTETRDAVLGNYVFTALAGVRYRAVVEGMQLLCTTAADRYAINIRTGGGSTPTASSTLWGTNSTVIVPGTTTTFSVFPSCSFIPGAGTQTLSLFVVQLSGSGTARPTGIRQIYVEAIGTL